MSTSFPPLPLSRRELLLAGSASVAGSAAWSAEAALPPAAASAGADIGGGAAPPSSPVVLKVNGSTHRLTLDNRTTLLDALREHLHLTGTKKGCDHGQCGACTVLVNDRRINACLTLAVMHQGDRVTTIEGLGTPGKLHPLQAAFVRHDGFPCGYCTPGQI